MNDNRRQRKFLRLESLVEIACLLATAGLLLSFFRQSYWILDLFTHFRWQYTGVFSVGVLYWSVCRRWMSAALSGAALMVALLGILPSFWPVDGELNDKAQKLHVLSYNVYTANPRKGDVLRYLEQSDADLIVLTEISDDWLKALAPVLKSYPHTIERPASDNFGMLVLSKFPLLNLSESKGEENVLFLLKFDLQMKQSTIRVRAIHPVPPASRWLAEMHRRQVSQISAKVEKDSGLQILLGDFNASPWSQSYAELQASGNLRNANRGHGVWPTWWGGFGLLATPIDHILVSDGIVVDDWGIGFPIGSDHSPVTAKLVLPSQ